MSEHPPHLTLTQRLSQLQEENPSYTQGIRNILLFLTGILIGWFVFGWWIAPIRYTQVYPNELHAEARSDYFRMVAESYAATQDIGMAAQRLKYWTPEELGPMLYAEAASLDEVNPAVAERLRQIATLLRLSPEGAVASAPNETGTSINEGAASILGLPLVRAGGVALLLLILIFLLARFLKLPQRLRQGEREGGAEEESMGLEDMTDEGETAPVAAPPSPFHAAPEAQPVWEDEEDGLAEAELAGEGEEEDLQDSGLLTPPIFAQEEGEAEGEEEPLSLPEEDLSTEPPTFAEEQEEEGRPEEPETFAEEEKREARAITAPSPPSAPSPETGPLQLGENTKRFVFDGDPYYNQIFAIEKEGEYLGEFGMGVGETLVDNPHQILTMEVWLFEKRDIRTVTAALMPPQIFRNESLRQELLEGDIIPIALEPGETLRLETEGLEVVGRVRRVEFSPSLEDRPTIRYLEVELAGQEKEGGSSVTRPSW